MNGNSSGTGYSKDKNDYWSRAAANRPGVPAAAIPPSYSRRQVPAAVTDEAAPSPGAGYSPVPVTLESADYLAGLLATLIGEKVRVQFLIGTTGPLIDVVGTLVQVGANYIVIQPIESDDLMICDLYSIKFITVLR